MTVKHRTWRLASLIAVSLVVSTANTSQAGIIPWVYDVIFGPVHHPAWGYSSYGYGYSSYAPYSVGYAPSSYGYSYPSYNVGYFGYGYSGCSTCSTGYGWSPTWGCGSCSSGCGPVALTSPCSSCGVTPTYSGSNYSPEPCLSGCDGYVKPKVPAKSNTQTQSNKPAGNWTKSNETQKPGTPRTPSKTFESPTDNDGLNNGTRTPGTRSDDDDTILPKRRSPFDTDNSNNPTDNNGASRRLPAPRFNLDAKVAWRTQPVRTRTPFYAKTTNVTIARRVPRVDAESLPGRTPTVVTQLVKK